MADSSRLIACMPRFLPRTRWADAIKNACKINPANAPHGLGDGEVLTEAPSERLAVDVQRYWGLAGVRLTVGFIDTPDMALRARILSHMNAWSSTADVTFTASDTDPQVRIARFDAKAAPGADGYWSNLGTDILLIDRDKPTMNLEAFTMDTLDSEFYRVVRHETGHTLGFPHEHMREAIIKRLDYEKVISFFMMTQGWTRQGVIDQVLTPLEESSLQGTPNADETSIMCYQIDGSLTLDGKPVVGGTDINASDRAFAATVYPTTPIP
jgi:hypothetical protein